MEVGVEQAHARAARREGQREVHGHGALPDAALAAHHRHEPPHEGELVADPTPDGLAVLEARLSGVGLRLLWHEGRHPGPELPLSRHEARLRDVELPLSRHETPLPGLGLGLSRHRRLQMSQWSCPGPPSPAASRLRTRWLGASRATIELGGTEWVSHTFPPITVLAPITVSPPRMVAPE